MPMTQPLSPAAITEAKQATIPPIVLEVVNEHLARLWNGSSARILLKGLVEALEPHFSREELFKNHYLDFEDIYREAGWTVVYDKPGYDETYDSFYLFKKA